LVKNNRQFPGRALYIRTSSGSLAIFAAIRRASSLLSNVAAERILEIDIGTFVARWRRADKQASNSSTVQGGGKRRAGIVQDFPGRDLKTARRSR
jgi:hypothetical protein